MKICLFGITGIPVGNHNIKDPRLDQVDKMVEAQKKCYAQVVLADEKELAVCDAILTSRAALSDLLMKDLDFVESRLERATVEAEKKVLQKMAEGLVSEKPVSKLGLTAEELAAISAHSFVTNRPVVAAEEAELAAPDPLLVRALAESGYISFLTVGGKENRLDCQSAKRFRCSSKTAGGTFCAKAGFSNFCLTFPISASTLTVSFFRRSFSAATSTTPSSGRKSSPNSERAAGVPSPACNRPAPPAARR
jgi:hypothetical protein